MTRLAGKPDRIVPHIKNVDNFKTQKINISIKSLIKRACLSPGAMSRPHTRLSGILRQGYWPRHLGEVG